MPSRPAAPLVDALSGRRLLRIDPPAAPRRAADAWRRETWRALEDPSAPRLVQVLAPAPQAGELAGWLAHRERWARALAEPGAAVRDPWLRGALELAQRDPRLARLIPASRSPRILPRHPSTFATVARAIAYQQLSGKAAATIWGRVCALFPEGTPEAGPLLRRRAPVLRACGLSAAKVLAVRDLAQHVVRGDLVPEALVDLPDEQVVERLTRVRGIGPWSAQMHLIFALGRRDVWPPGDLGVRVGLARILGLGTAPSPKTLEALGERYRPWRTLASWYAWRAIEIGFGDAPRA